MKIKSKYIIHAQIPNFECMYRTVPISHILQRNNNTTNLNKQKNMFNIYY